MNDSAPSKTKSYALWVLRLASLWVLAGALFKLWARNPNDLPPNLKELFAGHLTEFLRAAIGIELALVTLAWIKPRWAWFWMSGMFAVFIAVLAPMAISGAESCGCFGGTVKIPPVVMMAIDGTLLLAILAARPWRNIAPGHGVPAAIAALAVLACLALPWFVVKGEKKVVIPKRDPVPATTQGGGSVPDAPDAGSPSVAPSTAGTPKTGVTPMTAQQLGDWQTLDVAAWAGKRVEETKLAALVQQGVDNLPQDGKWVLYRKTCDHCAKYLLWLTAHDDGMPITLIEIGDDEADAENTITHVVPSGDHVMNASLVYGPEYIVTPPVVLELIAGEILDAQEGAEPPE